MQQYPSQLLEEAVNAFAKLPGIGRKSALRMALHVLRQPVEEADAFVEAVHRLRHDVGYCEVCHNVSDAGVCGICADASRDSRTVCVVESVKEVMLIENTGQYRGLYHVLGGIISPINGIGPGDLEIASLVERVADGGVDEVVLALNPTMEGDTTSFYIYRKLADFDVKITTIARGIAIGDDMEYADEVTLGRSIVNRVSYQTI
ncbi:MAG: recombination protein RecR [bacterium]|uniref:Recombination protein RecR n=1 Tax=Candidatus Aphodosoma intestinipullorum TaxID=2840674 RepID=A0A940DI69_9BACT|nr:recombination protein RecR [Candidatus Aphodosoma intestinipullorum]